MRYIIRLLRKYGLKDVTGINSHIIPNVYVKNVFKINQIINSSITKYSENKDFIINLFYIV